MWGLSVVERLQDRLTAFDSATTGAAQLLFKAYLRVIGVEGLRDALAIGGRDEEAVIKQFELIRQFQSIEGITLLDAEDAFHTYAYNFNGIAELLQQFERQISGALDMPIVRLFGMSPAGLNATGESDIRNYYDGITQQKEIQLRPGVQTLLHVISYSEFGRPLGEDFTFSFNPLWQMSEKEKAELFRDDMNAFAVAHDTGILQDWQILSELQRLAAKSGRGVTITEEDIENAKKRDIPPSFEEKGEMWQEIIQRADRLIKGGGVTNVPEVGNERVKAEVPWYWEEPGETVKTQEAATTAPAEVSVEVKQEILSKINDFDSNAGVSRDDTKNREILELMDKFHRGNEDDKTKMLILKKIDNFLNSRGISKGDDSKRDIITMIDDFLEGWGSTKDQPKELVLDKIKAFMGELEGSFDYRPDQKRHGKGVSEGGQFANEGKGYASGSEFAKKYGKSSSRGGGQSKTPSPPPAATPKTPTPSPSPSPTQQTGKQSTAPTLTATGGQAGTPTETEPPTPQQPTTASKTIEEAQQRAADLGVEANYTNFDIRMANMANNALEKTKQMFPEMPLLPVTSASTSAAIFERHYMKLGWLPEEAEEWANAAQEELMESSDYTASVCTLYDTPVLISFKDKYSQSYWELRMEEDFSHFTKWHSSGGTGATMHHEIGHWLDYKLGVSKDTQIISLFSQHRYSYTMKANLSEYADDGIEEFVSEGWSEYQTSENPRPVARMIGNTIIALYNKKFAKT